MKPYNHHPLRSSCWLAGMLCFFIIRTACGVQNTVVVWGEGPVKNVPTDVTNVASVAAGGDACFAVLRDGRLRAWGTSTNFPASATNVIAVSSSSPVHWCALRRDGTAVNYQGAVRATNSVAIAGTRYAPYALRRDGIVTAVNGYGTPYGSNVVAIAGGGYDTPRMLFANGTVSSVPYVTYSNVVAIADPPLYSSYFVALQHDGTVVTGSGPARPPGLSNVVVVAAGGQHGLALKSGGLVVAWGNNTAGQTNVPSGLSNVVAIAAGDYHSLALKADGTVVAWGNNSNGQTNVPAGLTNAAAIIAGPNYSVAIVGDSPRTLLTQPPDETFWSGRPATFTVKAIGTPPLRFQWQFNGEIIDGATNSFYRIESAVPANAGVYNVIVSNRRGAVISREAFLVLREMAPVLTGPQPLNQAVWEGSNATFSITAEGSAPFNSQWFFNGAPVHGANQFTLWLTNITLGQSGNYWVVVTNAFGARTSSVAKLTVQELRPVFTVNPANQSAWFGTGVGFYANAIGKSPITYEWFFDGTPFAGATQATLILDNLTWAQQGNYWCVASNAFGVSTSSVARLSILLTSGNITAWGDGQHGQNIAPTNVSEVSAIAAGGNFSMALLPDGKVIAWGQNFSGETNVPVGLSNVTAIAAGSRHGLALKADGRVVAWGDIWSGQTAVPQWLSNVVGIAAGQNHSLALMDGGTVVAWGRNDYGATNVPTGLSNVVSVAAGDLHSLVLKRDGTVMAWGSNPWGETDVPVGLFNAVAIAAGNSISLALHSNGTIVAWGRASVPSGLSNVVALSTAGGRGLALHSDGSVSAWREGLRMSVPPGLSNVVAVAVGYNHYLVLLDSGLVAPVFECRIVKNDSGTLALEVPTVRGKSYYLQHRDSLASPQWIMRPPVPGNGTMRTLVDADASASQRFYRVWQKP